MTWSIRAAAGAAALCVGLFASSANAGHHQWDIVEIFSNADGTIQFVELYGFGNNEHVLQNWTLAIQGGAVYTFPSNLPSTQTLDTRVLIATAGFTAVTPDYVIPDGFLPIAGGQLRYAGAASVVNYGPLPTDGIMSVNELGQVAVASPTNFAGETNTAGIPTLPQVGLIVLIGAVVAAIAVLLYRRPLARTAA